MSKMVAVEVTRPYPRGGTIHPVGSRIAVPEHAVSDAVAARPPFVRVLQADEVRLDADFDATEGALDLARSIGLDLSAYAGRGSGEDGRIQKPDVTEWGKAAGLIGE